MGFTRNNLRDILSMETVEKLVFANTNISALYAKNSLSHNLDGDSYDSDSSIPG